MLKERRRPEIYQQDKAEEIRFFSAHAQNDQYDVFTPETNEKVVRTCLAFSGLGLGARVFDLGCGSGVFTQLLHKSGLRAYGLDISHAMTVIGKIKYPNLAFVVGDVEYLPIASESLDGALLGGVLHHLPDLSRCAQELFRVLKPGGVFVAFDPNRLNPFMWLYRDRSSPFYSAKGVTKNERPIVAKQVRRAFLDVGFQVRTAYLSGFRYRYVASSYARLALPLYNFLDSILFRPSFLRPFSAFVVTVGIK